MIIQGDSEEFKKFVPSICDLLSLISFEKSLGMSSNNLFFYEYKGQEKKLFTIEKDMALVLCVDSFSLTEENELFLRDFSFSFKDVPLCICDMKASPFLSLIQIKNLLELKENKDAFLNFSKDLNDLLLLEKPDLERVKKIHSSFVSLRQENIGPIRIVSKYAAGKSSGGDFFHVYQTPTHALLLLSSASSYVASISLFKLLEDLQNKQSFLKEDLTAFLNKVCLSLSYELRPKLALISIDLKTLKGQGFLFAGHQFLSSQENQYFLGTTSSLEEGLFEKNFIEFQMRRGERWGLFSHGLAANCQNILAGKDFVTYARESLEKSTAKSFLNELFFQLKKQSQDKGKNHKFLEHDAFAIIIEVGQYALFEI